MTRIENTAELGKLISAERKRRGYTQAEMAGLCGVGITYVSNLENGKGTAEIEKALHILQMLGFDLFAQRRAS